jgi:hypothetical protein
MVPTELENYVNPGEVEMGPRQWMTALFIYFLNTYLKQVLLTLILVLENSFVCERLTRCTCPFCHRESEVPRDI